jgi:hypothetical protein
MNTTEIVNSFYNLEDALLWKKSNLPSYPLCPRRPKMPNTDATSSEFKEYAASLQEYESEKEKYDLELKEYNKTDLELDTVVCKFIWKRSGLDVFVPEPYREKVWDHAYRGGHSGGYGDIMSQLLNLVDIFKPNEILPEEARYIAIDCEDEDF